MACTSRKAPGSCWTCTAPTCIRRSGGDPGVFRPERFESSGFDLVPQGGGDHYAGHRGPGESATVDLVKSAAKLFATGIDYEVPPQDLSVSLRRIPTLPASGMGIGKVWIRT